MVTKDRLAPVPAATTRSAGAQFLIVGLLLVSVAATLVIMAMSAVSADDQIRWGAIALAAFCCGLLMLMSVAAGHDGLGLGLLAESVPGRSRGVRSPSAWPP